jgi:hypothetical protein
MANWSGAGTSYWAEIDMYAQQSGGIASGWYLEGLRSGQRHFHFDFLQNTVNLRYNFSDEGPTLTLPGIGSGAPIHLAATDQSPRYRLLINGAVVYDYTDPYAATPAAGYGFDCASYHGGSSGTLVVNGFRAYALASG